MLQARKVPADPFTGIMEMAEHGTLMIDRLVSLARMLTDLAPGRHPPWLYVTDEHNVSCGNTGRYPSCWFRL